jgi:hypothetical protein
LRRPGANRSLCVIGLVVCLAVCGRTEMPRHGRKDFAMEIRWPRAQSEDQTGGEKKMEEQESVSDDMMGTSVHAALINRRPTPLTTWPESNRIPQAATWERSH